MVLGTLDRFSYYVGFFFSYIKDKAAESPHLTKSLLIHFFLLIVASGMIPSCHKIQKPNVISIDILPLTDQIKPDAKPQKTQAKPQPKKIEPPKPKIKTPPKIVEQPKPKPQKQEAIERKKAIEPPQPKKADLPSPTKEEVKPKPEPEKDVVKKQELNKDTVEQAGKKSLLKDLEKKEESLDDLFQELDNKKEEIKNIKPQPQPVAQAQTHAQDEAVDQAFARDLMQKIKSQISRCWSIPIGVKDIQDIQVNLFIALDVSGNVMQVRILDTGLYASDNYYRVLADSAERAVRECSPLQGMPVEKYKFWKEIEFSFNPAMMAN